MPHHHCCISVQPLLSSFHVSPCLSTIVSLYYFMSWVCEQSKKQQQQNMTHTTVRATEIRPLYYYYYEMTQRQCAYRGVHLIERTVDVDVCTKRSRVFFSLTERRAPPSGRISVARAVLLLVHGALRMCKEV